MSVLKYTHDRWGSLDEQTSCKYKNSSVCEEKHSFVLVCFLETAEVCLSVYLAGRDPTV